MGSIYKITNQLNNKVYIGKTTKQPLLWWEKHLQNAFNTNLDYPLYRALRKYGKDNFSFDIIEDNIDDLILDDREKYWIAFYNSFSGEGYNATAGGDGNTLYNAKELAEKYLELHDINLVAESFGCSRRPVLEAIKKFNIYTGHKKMIYAVNKMTNEQTDVFDSINDACRILFNDVNKNKNVSAALHGRIKSAYGYYWYYI